jgi:uncharacterized protein (DUF736 family)
LFLIDGLVADRGQVVPSAALRRAEIRFPPLRRGPSAFRLAPCPDTICSFQTIETKEIKTMTNYVLTVPVTYKKDDQEHTTYRRVGAVFENTKNDTGETFLSIKLDFPVAVTELVAFQPKEMDAEEGGDQV